MEKNYFSGSEGIEELNKRPEVDYEREKIW
jgi:hypothetical protein